MKVVAFDVETETFSKGNPFDSRNKMCLAGVYDGEDYGIFDIEYSEHPYRESLQKYRQAIEEADLVVGFNLKFDCNWNRNYCIPYPDRIWDCQLVHFILTNQTHPYPSLNDVSEHYGLGSKIDKIAEYWDQGIQTTDIDYDELDEYLRQDLNLTLRVYYKQLEELERRPHLKKLVNVSNMDTLVLADMEYNGLKFNFKLSQERAEQLETKIQALDEKLRALYDIPGINWNSNDHLSAILYGGILKVPFRETYERTLKDGTVRIKERNAEKEVMMDRLVEPLKGTETDKSKKLREKGEREGESVWSVGEDVLKSLKAKGKAKEIISIVLERSLLDKELNTYALGLPKLYDEKHYTDNIIHGNLNQCVARTGRLSSSSPNCQNFSDGAKQCIISRF